METTQAPNIEPGRGRLVYDKTRRTIVGVHAPPAPHPLGFHIWRNRGGWPSWSQNVREAWWCLIGRWSLHRAWQKGYDQHIVDECARRANGGR